ncbi:glycosyltransferase [Actinomadura viridis]|uniref:MGT family glycosyltransferase n=1 Tax=Actinomadura viridis TaxID=58110 RepID=A0A931DJK0_9ACTN|nr:nucleotide disphospho-sugar-binding domain-containing protein [Actinomadura viridis]MBG6091195.1 MGT family glycosyltransferase [Actinomadura viridis]
MSARRVRVPSLFGDGGDPGTERRPVPEEAGQRRRFLFAVPPLAGHVAPTVGVASELVRRGHKVAWAGRRAFLEPLLRRGSQIFQAEDEASAARLDRARDEWLGMRGPDGPRFLWEEFAIPLGHAMMPGLEAAVKRFRPDVVVSDQLVVAAPVAARLRGLPWATSAATSAGLVRPPRDLAGAEERVRELIGGFQLAHGIDDLIDLRFSDHLVLAFTTGALIGDTAFFPDHFAFAGPALRRPSTGDFPWRWLDEGNGRPVVLVSPGGDGPEGVRLAWDAAEAVADMDVRAVIVAPPEAVPGPPPGVLVRERVPRLTLLKRMAAVVCQGGHNTVCEALANGLPLVVVPVRADQEAVARQVAGAGAGIIVPGGRAGAAGLRSALGAVLDGDAPREAAARVAESFAAAGGAVHAADRLEKLA